MNESMEPELRQFYPVSPTPELALEIAAALDGSPGVQQDARNNRWLIGAMSLGLAAAVAIVAMLFADMPAGGSDPRRSPESAVASSNGAAFAQIHEALSQLAAGNDPLDPWPKP
jgi:hypothetical protein